MLPFQQVLESDSNRSILFGPCSDVDGGPLSPEAVDAVERLVEVTQEGAVERVAGPARNDPKRHPARKCVPVTASEQTVEHLAKSEASVSRSWVRLPDTLAGVPCFPVIQKLWPRHCRQLLESESRTD